MARLNSSESTGYLQITTGALAAQLHASSSVLQTLLIMPPLFEERKCCQRTVTTLCRQLPDTTVLRVDLRGSGDSPPPDSDYTLADWLAEWRETAAALRQRHPHVPQIWLGIRTSALLVLQQAAASPPAAQPDAVILWEPVTGPDFLRQLLQRRQVNEMLAYGKARRSRQAMAQAWQDGESVDCDGYALTPRLHQELQQLQPTPWHGAGFIVSTSPDTRTADTCHQLAPAATCLPLRLPPFWNSIGHVDTQPLVEATTRWLQNHAPRLTAPPPPADAETTRPPLLQPTTQDCAEQLITIPTSDGQLRGVLHTPAPASRGRIVFLHGWSGDRTGPHRMFVHAARELCLQGYTCLRFDFRGRGHSDDLPTAGTIASMTADTHAALAWLRTAAPAGGPITLLAICSGCKVAISTAATAPDIANLALWSAESMGSLRHAATTARKRRSALLAYTRKFFLPETWRKLLRGQLHAGMISKALAPAEVRSAAEARSEDATLQSFRKYRGSILLVFGGSDPDAPGSLQGYTTYCRTYGIAHTCHTVPHAGHSYYGLEWEREVLQVTAQWLSAYGPN